MIEVNELQKRRVVQKLEKHLGSLVGKRIALLGLAFKPNTDDMREASSLVLSARLQAEGATVVAYDPVAERRPRSCCPASRCCEHRGEALEGADAAILVTEWAEFGELDWEGIAVANGEPAGRGRTQLPRPGAMRAAGLVYEGIGRRPPPTAERSD